MVQKPKLTITRIINLTMFWSSTDVDGAVFGPGDGMKYLPVWLAAPTSRDPNIPPRYGSAECDGYASNVPAFIPPS